MTVALLFLLISVTSCSLEQRLGRKYVKENQKEALLILPADFIYKTNLTFQEPDPVNLINEEVKDSVGYFTSTYLQYISDSVFLEKFYNAFISELGSTGYRLFLPGDSNLFKEAPGSKWMIRFAQLQLEEESTPYFEDTYDPDEKYYYKEYELTSFGMNSWTEATFAGSEDQKRLLYLSGYIEDEFEGGFNYNRWEDKMYFDNTTSRITYNDIYEMAEASGKKHAELLTDYLINDYIRRNMPPGTTRRIILHYDRRFRTLTTDVEERFEVLK
jgi:hypothetical protein